MAWRKPTVADIAATLSQNELDAYRQLPEFKSGADPIEALLSRTVSYVRAKIRRNGQVRMSPSADELPESLISPAMDYAAFDILKRQPVNMTEERRQAREQAIAEFERVADGRSTPESYEGGEDATGRASVLFADAPFRVL